MKAIILAAGRGRRMDKLTEESPKCLIELNGKALIEWQLDALRSAGISDIAIVTGYKRELLGKYDLVEFHNPNWNKTDMVCSLACADKWLTSEPCIVTYSDIFYSSKAVKSLLSSDALIAVTYDPDWLSLWSRRFDDPLSDAETFRLNKNKVLIEIGKKPGTVSEVEGQFMGLIRLTPCGWNETKRVLSNLPPQELNRTQMTGVLQKIVESGIVPIIGIEYLDIWGELDTPDDKVLYSIG